MALESCSSQNYPLPVQAWSLDTHAQALTSPMEAQTSPSAWAEDHLPVATVAVRRRFSHVPAFQKHTVPLLKFHQQLRKTPCAPSFPPAAHCRYWLHVPVPSKADNFPLLTLLQLIDSWFHNTPSAMPTQALKSRSASLCGLLPGHAK